jgi:hypothetical protein
MPGEDRRNKCHASRAVRTKSGRHEASERTKVMNSFRLRENESFDSDSSSPGPRNKDHAREDLRIDLFPRPHWKPLTVEIRW